MKHNIQASRARQHGVSLMELLITVAIVGIIASIAIPSYRQHIMRSNRADATSALLNIAGEQEKFFLQNNSYTNDFSADGLGLDQSTNNGYYGLSIQLTDNGAGFVATASNSGANSNGRQGDDTDCKTFTLDETGARGATGDEPSLCWR